MDGTDDVWGVVDGGNLCWVTELAETAETTAFVIPMAAIGNSDTKNMHMFIEALKPINGITQKFSVLFPLVSFPFDPLGNICVL